MQPAPLSRRVAHVALGLALALVTLGQILRPGINQDVRYVVGALHSGGAAGLAWTEIWAHRPLAARGVIALLSAVAPGEFWAQEVMIRVWCVLLAAGAAVLLWRGLRGWCTPRVAGWTAVATGAALAWAPGWDFAEPEWFAAALSVAAVGLALHRPAGARLGVGAAPNGTDDRPEPPLGAAAVVAGVLLGLVVLLKFTTTATAVGALLVLAVVDRRRAITVGFVAALASSGLFALTMLLEPHEWQWLVDMPTLNPGFTISALPRVAEGLVNSLVVSPVTLAGLVATGWLLRDRRTRRWGLLALVGLAILTVPFVAQQQGFLYHLAAVPVAAAGLAAAVAAHAGRVPPALPVTGTLGLTAGVGLFALGPRTRADNWEVAAAAVAFVLVVGVGLLALRRGAPGPGVVTTVLIAAACLAPLLVTVSPRTAYSFSLAHNRTTPADNRAQAVAGPDRAAAVRRVLPGEERVVYLSFSAPYWVRNPTPCRYVSPTFLQRAGGDRTGDIAATPSYAENLACLGAPDVQAVVIEPDWFNVDRARPGVRAALLRHFDCGRRVEVDSWVICPSR